MITIQNSFNFQYSFFLLQDTPNILNFKSFDIYLVTLFLPSVYRNRQDFPFFDIGISPMLFVDLQEIKHLVGLLRKFRYLSLKKADEVNIPGFYKLHERDEKLLLVCDARFLKAYRKTDKVRL